MKETATVEPEFKIQKFVTKNCKTKSFISRFSRKREGIDTEF